MAESAGLALGVVSLALEVCKGIIAYTDAVRGRAKELEGLRRQADSLSDTLVILVQTIDRIRAAAADAPVTTTTTSLAAVEKSIISCEIHLRELESFIAKYSGGCCISSSVFKQKCVDIFGSMKFGFRQKEVGEMMAKLAAVNNILITGIQNLALNQSIDSDEIKIQMSAKIDALETAIGAVTRDSERTLRSLSEQATTLEGLCRSTQIIATDSARIADLGSNFPEIVDNRLDVLSSDLKGLTIATGEEISVEIAALRETIQEQMAMLTALSTGFDSAALQLLGQRPVAQATALGFAQECSIIATSKASNTLVMQRPSQPWAMCDCRQYRMSRSWRSSRKANSQLALTQQNIFEHNPTCPFSRVVPKRQDVTQSFNARFRVSSTGLGRIFDFSLGLSLDAGSFSLKPQLSVQRTVDEHSSPAFKVIFALNNILRSDSARACPPAADEFDELFALALQKLRRAFASGEALSTDTNEYGQTILSAFILEIMFLPHNIQARESSGFATFVWQLVNVLHVPVRNDVLASTNRSPLSMALYAASFGNQWHKSVLSLLIPRPGDTDDAFTLIRPGSLSFVVADPFLLKKISFEPDPISEAILCNRPDRARELARYYPALFESKPALGFCTHLHLAIGARQCFSELLLGLSSAAAEGNTTASDRLSSLLACRDGQGRTLAEYLVMSCQRRYLYGLPRNKSTKPCWSASMLEILFSLGCSMRHHSLYVEGYQCTCCLDLYTTELVRRRQALRHLATHHLTTLQSKQFALDRIAPLDRHVGSVVKALREIRVNIPCYLITVDNDSDICSFWSEVFHGIEKHVVWLTSLYSAGFKDISESSADGSAALKMMIQKYSMLPDGLDLFNKIEWVVEHNLEGSTNLCEAWGLTHATHPTNRSSECVVCRHENAVEHGTIAHFLGGSVGFELYHEWRRYHSGYDEFFLELRYHPLLTRVLPLTITDDTSCACSPRGRTPFLYMLMDFLDPEICLDTPQRFADVLEYLVNAFGHLWEAWQFKAAVRLMTFEALAMEHTCDFDLQDMSHDDQETAHDSVLVGLLEDITTELDALIDKAFTTTSSSATTKSYSQGSEPEIVAGGYVDEVPQTVRAKHCQAIATMRQPWLKIWVDRLDAVLDHLCQSDVATKHRDATEKLGVSWCAPPPRVTESKVEKTREYWMNELKNM